jgi:hypothetical protein
MRDEASEAVNDRACAEYDNNDGTCQRKYYAQHGDVDGWRSAWFGTLAGGRLSAFHDVVP